MIGLEILRAAKQNLSTFQSHHANSVPIADGRMRVRPARSRPQLRNILRGALRLRDQTGCLIRQPAPQGRKGPAP